MALRHGPTRHDVGLLATILELTRMQQGRPPTMEEVARALGFPGPSAKGNVQRQLLRLRPTYVTWDRTARSLALTARGTDWVRDAERNAEKAKKEDEDEEGTMRTQHGGEHPTPSARLSSGQVADFAEALVLVEQELACEDRAYRIMDEGQAPIKAALGHARRVWREEQEAARLHTVQRLRADALAAEAALDDEASRWLGLLADALEQGDYSGLAI